MIEKVNTTEAEKQVETSLPLKGVIVIDLTQGMAGPMGTRLLADFGADVIKVEPRARGDWLRGAQAGSTADMSHGAIAMSSQPSRYNFVWENLNRNKRGITVDLNQNLGKEIIYRLVEKGDVFTTNFRPKEIERFNLDYETLSRLNPRLIYAGLTGYGESGHGADEPGYDSTAFWARSGIWNVAAGGATPPYHTNAVGDNSGGLCFAYGILLALFERERTGIGQKVEASLFNAGIWAMTWEVAGALATGLDPKPQPRDEIVNAAANCYRTKDGRWIRITLPSPERYWSRLCKVIEREDMEHDPRFDTLEASLRNHYALFKILDEEVFPTKTLAEWKERFSGADIPFSPLQTITEVITDPQAIANDYFISYEHPTYGPMKQVASPVKLSRTPATIRMPAPEFTQHVEEILLEFGYTWDDIEEFKQKDVID